MELEIKKILFAIELIINKEVMFDRRENSSLDIIKTDF